MSGTPTAVSTPKSPGMNGHAELAAIHLGTAILARAAKAAMPKAYYDELRALRLHVDARLNGASHDE